MPRSITFSPSLRFGTIFHCLHQRNSCTCMSGTRKERSCRSRPCMSVLGGWSQPVDATLYLMERWSVLWVEDFIEGLLRQRRRSYGIAGSEGSREGDRTSFWQAVIVDPFPGGTARGHSSCPAAPLQADIDACGTRGDFQRRYGTSIGTIDRQVAWPLTLDGEPGNEPQRRLETILNVRNWTRSRHRAQTKPIYGLAWSTLRTCRVISAPLSRC